MSQNKKILFRADGNSDIGLGHIYRILAIVEFYKENYEFVIVLKETSLVSIIPEAFKTIRIPEKTTIIEEPKWLSDNFTPENHIIIADGYQFISTYQKALKESGFTLIYIDDLASEYMFADIVVNHSPYTTIETYKAERHTKFALGTSYAMLRPLFNEAAKKEREIEQIKNAFVCFGGSDQYDLSLLTAKALLNISTIKNIYIVLGGAYKHNEIITLEKENNNIHLYKNLDEAALYQLMNMCQVAIAPSSTILYEICSVKMPVLSGYYVENQKNIYKGLAEKNIIAKGGDFTNYTVLDFEEKIKSILNNNSINIYTKNQHKLFKGDSKINFLGLINSLNISFRKAEEKDVIEVYNWSNDALVRKNSYNSSSIKLEDHKKWFSKKIKDKNTLFLIALVNNKPSGIVRFDIDDEHSIVGILVSKNFRGQKLASEFLKKSTKEYFKIHNQPILAYIKKENNASIKAFENAGYKYFKDEKIKGCVSFVYKLKRKDVKR